VYGWHYSDIPALGIWRGVRLRRVPAVRLQTPLVATRDAARGEISLRVDLAGEAVGWRGVLRGTIAPETFPGQTFSFLREVISAQAASALHLAMTIPDVRPWFPNGMGAPDLYRLTLSFARDDGAADNCETTFGVRTVTMAPLPGGVNPKTYDWTFVINGAPRFIKGSGWCTMDSSMDFSRPRYERFLELARRQHVQMLRAWGSGMPETDDFYDLCDRKGILVMQEWPTAWNSDRVQPFEMLEETVRLNTLRIRNHPSLAMYGGGNESGEPFSPAIDMMGRYAVELDGTRPFHRSEPWGGSDHNYGCWWGRQHLDFNLTMTSAFWGEFGIASMPVAESVRRYLPENEKNAWPAPADGSLIHHTPVFNRAQDMERLTQYAGYLTAAATMDDFIRGSQVAQAIALRHTLERARTRWPECTGALYYKMNDNYPAASWAVADWYGAVKIAHYFCRSAFAPLHAVALFDHLDCAGKRLELPVFLLDDSDDLRRADWQVRVRALDGKLAQFAEKRWDGRGAAGPVHRLGEFVLDERQTAAAPLFIVCDVEAGGKLADRGYYFVNFEAEKDSLFRLPRTTLAMKKRDGAVELTNTGTAPAVGAALERPGHADTFLADDNFLWLEPGEMRSVAVNTTEGLIAAAWNAATVR
jgi:beta-mannosidase